MMHVSFDEGFLKQFSLCTLEWGPFERSRDASVKWYANNEAYGLYNSSNNHNHKIVMGKCDFTNFRGIWRTNKIGPFKSHGGYDWLQLSWADAMDIETRGVTVLLGNFFGALDTARVPIGNPPIHQHHVHMFPSKPGSMHRTSALRTFEHHGDWQFESKSTLVRFYAAWGLDLRGAGLRVPSLSVDVELNDVRPVSSPSLVWFYNIAVLMARNGSTPKLSMHRTVAPGQNCELQFCDVYTFNVPMHRDTLLWYLGQMPYAGRMVFVKVHAHQRAFHGYLLFRGSPLTLGLSSLGIITRDESENPPFIPMSTASTPFISNECAMKSLTRLLQDFLICRATSNMERIAGVYYDRAAMSTCAEYTFGDRDMFTAIAFNGPTLYESNASIMRQHLNLYMLYEASDGKTHHTWEFNAHDFHYRYRAGDFENNFLLVKTESTGDILSLILVVSLLSWIGRREKVSHLCL